MQAFKTFFVVSAIAAVSAAPCLHAQDTNTTTDAQTLREFLRKSIRESNKPQSAPGQPSTTPAPAAQPAPQPVPVVPVPVIEPAKKPAPAPQPVKTTPPPAAVEQPAPVEQPAAQAAPAATTTAAPAAPASDSNDEVLRKALREQIAKPMPPPESVVAVPQANETATTVPVQSQPATPKTTVKTKPARTPVFEPDTTATQANETATIATPVETQPAAPKKAVKTKVEPTPTAPIEPPPLSSAPASKEQRLTELLWKYKADAITPEDYHKQRAAILAEP